LIYWLLCIKTNTLQKATSILNLTITIKNNGIKPLPGWYKNWHKKMKWPKELPGGFTL